MDEKPFFELNILDSTMRKWKNLDVLPSPSTCAMRKYTREIKRLLTNEWSNPSEDLARYFAQIYEGTKTKAVIDQFLRVTKKALNQLSTTA